jgi:hypothetical protein
MICLTKEQIWQKVIQNQGLGVRLFIIISIMGIYLANGEVEIRSHDILPFYGDQSHSFNSRQECETFLLAEAKSKANYYADTQTISYSNQKLVVSRNKKTNGWFDTVTCLEIKLK